MRFNFAFVLVISALTFIVSAQTSSTISSGPQNPISYPLGGTVKSGSSITITWNPTYGNSIDLVLREGENTNLDTVETIASGIPNSGSFVWSIPKDLAAGNDYSVEIISGSETNYSPLFGIDSTIVSSTTSSSTTSSSTTSSSSFSSSPTSLETLPSMPISSTSSATSTATTAFSSGSPNSTFTTSHTRSSSSTATGTTAPGGNQAASVNAGSDLAIPFSFIFSILFGFIAGLVYLY